MHKLTPQEIHKFKRILLGLKTHLLQLIHESSEEVKSDDPEGYSEHQANEGADNFGKEMSIYVTSNEMDILKQVIRALEKIDEGTYGICDVTGEAISRKRLEAVPYATMTRGAQEKSEKGL